MQAKADRSTKEERDTTKTSTVPPRPEEPPVAGLLTWLEMLRDTFVEESRKAGAFEASRPSKVDVSKTPHRAVLDENDHWQRLQNDCDGSGLKDQWLGVPQQARDRGVG